MQIIASAIGLLMALVVLVFFTSITYRLIRMIYKKVNMFI